MDGLLQQDHRGDGDGYSMPLVARRVTPGRKARSNELPSELCAGALQLAGLQDSGLAAQVDLGFRLARRGGFGGLELFAFAVLFLSAGPQSSIRAFCAKHARNFSSIAAIVGRRALPSAASISRALSRLPAVKVESLTDTLLAAVPGRRELLSHPAVAHRDARGDAWHVFDFDPTTRPFRQRDLPAHPDLPDAERRVEAVPGYVGRKRGEVRQQDHLLQHAGSGLWVFYRLNAAGGSATPHLAKAAAAARACVDDLGHPACRTLIRTDGEFGHAAALRACVAQGLHHLVRLARYHLLERPEVRSALSGAVWRPVPHSAVGKEAADLGTLMLYENDGESDGVPTRVVVTRFPTTATEARRGVLEDGHQLEMFGTSLPVDAWPAEDVVALYAGRNTIENSFAQEDREYDLERTFSYTATGQAFFVTVGLFLWNDAICRAAAALPMSDQLSKQELRPAPIATPFVPPITEPVVSGPSEDPEPAEMGAESSPPEPVVAESLKELMIEAASGRRLLDRWRFDEDCGVLRCPTGNPLHPYHVEVARRDEQGNKVGNDRVSLRSAVGICDGCPLRPACFAGKRHTYKQATWFVPHDLAGRMKPVLAALRPRPPRVVSRQRRRAAPADAPVGEVLFRPPTAVPPAPLIPQPPSFSPGAARRRVRDALRDVHIEVVVSGTPRRPTPHPLLRTGARPETRLSWTQRRRRAQRDVALVIATAGASARRILAIPSA